MSENSLRVAELLNPDSPESMDSFRYFLLNNQNTHIFFEKNFEDFYENTDPLVFSIPDILNWTRDDELKASLLENWRILAVEGKIPREDSDKFLFHYVEYTIKSEGNYMDNKKLPHRPISEESKEKIQEVISPETALNLLKLADNPIYTNSLLRSIGIDNPEIRAHLETRLPDMAREISADSRYSLSLQMILQELLDEEKVSPSEIEYVAKGGFGRVFKIGDKILKASARPFCKNLPYNSQYFLQPLIRQDVPDAGFLEIYENVDVGGSVEDMYQLYKALREQGLVWTDIKSNNIGRLRKENSIHFDGIDYVSHRAANFTEEKEIPVAQPGDFVLIDLDFVFPEGTKVDVPRGETSELYYRFSNRYEKEKAKERGESITVDKATRKKTSDFDEI